MSDDLIIKIGSDVEGAKKGIASIDDATKDLAKDAADASNAAKGLFAFEGLEKIGDASKEAFNILKEQPTGSIEAYAESEDAARRLTNALQNQGIFTEQLKEDYDSYAKSVSALTGIQGDEITKAQAVAQSFLGQIPITEELTQSIADLAVQQGISLPQAAEEMGKAIGNGTGQLLRQGLQFSATDSEADRYQKTLEFVSVKAGGFAASANTGIGAMKGLQSAFKDSSEVLGEKFAPAVTFVIESLTNLIRPTEEGSDEITNLKASFLVAGLALSAVGVALPIVGQGIVLVKAATQAFNITLTATKVALASIGIGLLIIALTELYLHWDMVSGRIKAIVQGLVTYVVGYFKGLGTVLNGVFHLDLDKVKQGILDIGNAMKNGFEQAIGDVPEKTEEALDKQESIKKKFADKQAKDKADQDAIKKQLQISEDQEILLELQNSSEAQIALKKQEIETLKALEKNRNVEQKQLLVQRLTQIQDLEVKQQAEDKQRDTLFASSEIAIQKKFSAEKIGIDTDLSRKEVASIKATEMTVGDVQKKAYADGLKEEIKAHNTYLEEQNKYGTAYAAINQVMHTSEVEGLKQATGELAQLTQSKNATLKAIGKAATIANIVIKTAESAMNIYSGLSIIPIVGPALGIAGAAAAIAFGAEQIGNVVAAQTGGIVPGSGYGDKIPAVLEPGELITPRQNFDEVVNSVAQQRAGEAQHGSIKGEVGIKVGFNGSQASRVITIKQNEDKALGISRAST